MSKIIAKIKGGLGNQLFIYAAAKRLALKSGSKLILDHVSDFRGDKFRRTFQLNKFNIDESKIGFFSRTILGQKSFRKVAKLVNTWLAFSKRWYIFQEKLDFDYRLLIYKPKKLTFFDGYWQSEDYFKDIESEIRDYFKIIAPISEENFQFLKFIKNKTSVALHVRFFESDVDETGINTSILYYNNAVTKILDLVPKAHFFVFSDNLELAINKLSIEKSRLTIVPHNTGDENAYQDLWLMSKCDHFIIANSTFSWWGAWLGTNKNKIVIAPDMDLKNSDGAWGFSGLIPEKWIKI
jgi:hypothetical protein